MKYVVDPALCCAHGQCYALAPDVFTPAEDGYNAEAGNTVEVPEGLEDEAREGAWACPESAIMVMD
ncbi:MAG TPA: ferredoxin [Pseudonocardia sp.]|nr:ferredoxin [Pseudonocardia sp.]